MAPGGHRTDAGPGCDGPEPGVEPEPADSDQNPENDKDRTVGLQLPAEPPLALVQEIATEFIDLPLQFDDGGTRRAGIQAGCRGSTTDSRGSVVAAVWARASGRTWKALVARTAAETAFATASPTERLASSDGRETARHGLDLLLAAIRLM